MYFVYKITNIINQEFYLGCHKTNNINDNYLGSGLRIKRSIKKYGIKNFRKEIISTHKLPQNAFKDEILVIEKHINNPLCLNIALGGKGGALFKGKHHTEKSKRQIALKVSKVSKGRKKSLEAIESEKQSRYKKNNGKYFSEETIAKLRSAAIGNTPWNKKSI